jgi:heptosyltransferase III
MEGGTAAAENDRAADAAERVVVFRPGALGDALLAFPALAALRRAKPAAHVALIARADVLPLALTCRLADAVYPFDLPAWAALWGDAAASARRNPLLDRVVAGADAAVAWLSDPDGAVARNLRALGVRLALVAPGRPASAGDEHAALYLLRSLAVLGLGDLPGTLAELSRRTDPLMVGPQAQREAQATLRQLALPEGKAVALHTGSGGAAKRWLPERFAEIARRLRGEGYAPLLVEGTADAEPVAQTVGALGGQSVPVARGLAVEVLAALLGRCAGYLGNDSGVTHLGGLAGTPTLALFGPSDPAIWRPVGRHVRVLRAGQSAADASPPMGGLDVPAVWEALVRALVDGQTS